MDADGISEAAKMVWMCGFVSTVRFNVKQLLTFVLHKVQHVTLVYPFPLSSSCSIYNLIHPSLLPFSLLRPALTIDTTMKITVLQSAIAWGLTSIEMRRRKREIER